MTTITQAPATDTATQGASVAPTVEGAKDAAKPTHKRTIKPASPKATKPAPKAPTKDEVRKMSEAHDKAQAAKGKAAPKGKAASKPGKAAPSGKVALYFIITGRPIGGPALFAHTEAFFRIYDMYNGKGAPLSTARMVMGPTAVNNHVTGGKFEKREGKLFLTKAGVNHFKPRNEAADPELITAYMAIMTTGKADGRAVKVQDNIGKLA